MLKQRRFVISYLLNHQPKSLDVLAESESISGEEAKKHIESSLVDDPPANITDIYIVDIYCHPDSDLSAEFSTQSKSNL